MYPLTSPNGSTIIIYGHEQGLRVIWRGGRPLKEGIGTTQEEPNTNGANEDAVMSMGSSDQEVIKNTRPKDEPAFQDEEDEYDPSAPYQSIVQTLDLPLGLEVLHISFPSLPPDLHRSSLPTLVKNSVLVASACSDCTIRVLSIPLTPPSPRRKAQVEQENGVTYLSAGRSLYGEQMIVLSNGFMHQSIPNDVSISMTAAFPDDLEDVDMEDEDEDENARRPPPSRHTSRSRSRSRLGKHQAWDLLVASHSKDLSGLLLMHRIPLVADGTSISTEMHIPWRTQHLASPAVSIDFSSALYPAPQHSQLLIAEKKGSVRIFDCLPRSTAAQGSWLVSLHTDFENSQNALPRRKSILAAQWVLGGKAILVLLADGKWGIWNHGGRGPIPAETTSGTRIKSASLFSSFAIEGWVGASLKSKPLLKSSSAKNESRSKLAPMTPSTRKMKQDVLFAGPSIESDGPARGGLCIVPTSDTASSRPDDESVLLWYGTNVMTIPSLFTHWQNKVRGSGNLFGSGAQGEPRNFSNIQLAGERCNEINLLPNHPHLSSGSGKDSSAQKPEILVTGEKRLLVITPPLAEPEPPASAPAATTAPQTLSNPVADQQLLARGELDVNGMERILAGMSNGHHHTPRRSSQAPSRGQNLLSI